MTDAMLFEQLAYKLINELPVGKALYSIIALLKEQMPFDLAYCARIDRKNHIQSILMEYSDRYENGTSYAFTLGHILSLDENRSMYGHDFTNVHICNDISKDPTESMHLLQMPFYCASSVSTILNFDLETDTLCSFCCFSKEKDSYVHEHAEILKRFRPLLITLMQKLMELSYDDCLCIDSNGPIPGSVMDRLLLCPGLSGVVELIESFSKVPFPVFIYGETGVGKELVAEALHILSPRTGRYVCVNCGAIPESLAESELFGFERGSFTGANRTHKGVFEQANHGTLYLDEIGELPLNIQAKLLRVLENNEISRIGSERKIKLDVRVIAGTNRELDSMVKDKKFRLDLYYRIKNLYIKVPSLSERPEDIPILADYFYRFCIKELHLKNPPELSRREVHRLLEHQWPGNVRQLRAFIESSLIKALGKKNAKIHFDFSDMDNESFLNKPQGVGTAKKNPPRSTTPEEILYALEQCGGKIQGSDGAAKFLGLAPATLRSRMQALGLPMPKEIRKNSGRSQI